MSDNFLNNGDSPFKNPLIPAGYKLIKSLSVKDHVLLCKESATDRHIVFKFFTQDNYENYLNEANSLLLLEQNDFSPKFHFAMPYGSIYILAQEYLYKEKPLASIDKKFTYRQYEQFKLKLNSTVFNMHHICNYTHGDLSPRNLFVSFEANQCKVKFIDWEMAKSLNDEKLSDYTLARGTPGYSFIEDRKRLEHQEKVAAQKCAEFFLKELTHASSIIPKKGFSLWGSKTNI